MSVKLKRLAVGVLLTLLALYSNAQAPLKSVKAKTVDATTKLKLSGYSVSSFSNDETSTSKSSDKLITERAAKLYADGLSGGGPGGTIQDIYDAHTYVDYEGIISTSNAAFYNYGQLYTYAYGYDGYPFSGGIDFRALHPSGNKEARMALYRADGAWFGFYRNSPNQEGSFNVDTAFNVSIKSSTKNIKVEIDSSNLPQNMLYVDAAGRIWKAAKPSTGTSTFDSTKFIYDEVPSGTVNSVNTVFTLAFSPIANKYTVFINGIKQRRTTDYSISTNAITFTTAPQTGDDILIDYIK